MHIIHKRQGNTAFQVGDFSSATRHYRKGVNQLKKLNEGNTVGSSRLASIDRFSHHRHLNPTSCS